MPAREIRQRGEEFCDAAKEHEHQHAGTLQLPTRRQEIRYQPLQAGTESGLGSGHVTLLSSFQFPSLTDGKISIALGAAWGRPRPTVIHSVIGIGTKADKYLASANLPECCKTMRFSVVIPLYNKAPHVVAAVRSALTQSLAPAEVVVVDDGSNDGSLELAQSVDDPRVRVLTRSTPGPGGYAARNLGIQAAKSEWVAFLDADDLWRQNHLQSLGDAISAAGGEVGCALGGSEFVFSDRRSLRAISTRLLAPCVPLGTEVMLQTWLKGRECPLWTSAVA